MGAINCGLALLVNWPGGVSGLRGSVHCDVRLPIAVLALSSDRIAAAFKLTLRKGAQPNVTPRWVRRAREISAY